MRALWNFSATASAAPRAMRWSTESSSISASTASACGRSKSLMSRPLSVSWDWQSHASTRRLRPAWKSAGAWPSSIGGTAMQQKRPDWPLATALARSHSRRSYPLHLRRTTVPEPSWSALGCATTRPTISIIRQCRKVIRFDRMYFTDWAQARILTCVELRGRRACGRLSYRRRPAKRCAEPVPDIDRRHGRREVRELLLGEFRARLRIDLVADALAEQRQRLRPGQRRTLAGRELRRLAPDHHQIEFIGGHAELLALQDVILHAEGTAIDLRGAQLDQFEQLLVHASLARDLAERQHGVIGVGR